MIVTARHHLDSCWVKLRIRGDRIVETPRVEGPEPIGPEDDWVAPAFWDIQINGRWGHSFSSPELTVEQVAEIVRAQATLGTARLCPTLITAPAESMRHGVRTIAAACDAFPDIAARVVGIHLEGPFLSERDGYRGAHPIDAMRDPDWGFFQDLQEASGRRIVLITLAPERSGAIAFIRKAVESGIIVSLGHTAADGATIRAAVAGGARLSTHLGNGIASPLPRHPNPIWEQAAADELSASLIADGHHLDRATLRVLARAKGPALHPRERRQPPGRPSRRNLRRVGRGSFRQDRRGRYALSRWVESGTGNRRTEPVAGNRMDVAPGHGRHHE